MAPSMAPAAGIALEDYTCDRPVPTHFEAFTDVSHSSFVLPVKTIGHTTMFCSYSMHACMTDSCGT